MRKYFQLFLNIFLLALVMTACGGSTRQGASPTDTSSPKPASTEEASVEESQMSAKDHILLGRDYFDHGEFEQARDELQAALDLEPDNEEALIGLGDVYSELGQFEQAIPFYESVLARNSENKYAHRCLCIALIWVQPPKGESQCKTAIELDPQNAELHNGLGVAQYKQDKFEEAIVSFQKAVEIDPRQRDAHYNLGHVYVLTKNYEAAIPELEKSLQFAWENDAAYYDLGISYTMQNDYEQAIPNYEKAIKFNPDSATSYNDLGFIYRELGEKEKAIAAFEKYLELRPDTPYRDQYEAIIVELKGISMQSEQFSKAQIAFVSERDGDLEIYRMNTDGSSLVRLTDNPASDIEPDWSPDGKYIVFASDRNGNFDIYQMKADGTDLTQLTDDPANDFSPTWSPNGTVIAFMSERSGTPSIYRLYTDGAQIALFNKDNNTILTPTYAYGIVNQGIAFVAKTSQGESFDLYYFDDAKDNVTKLAEGLGDMLSPDWAPNGRYIVFAANVSGSQNLFLIRPDGSNLMQLTQNDVEENKPCFSPDSNFIMYSVGQDEMSEIEIRDENGAVIRVTDNDVFDGMPTWGPME